MKLLAISDLHLGHAANRAPLRDVPPHPEDWLIVLAGIDHRLDLPDDLERSLDMHVRRDLYLVFKELLNNVARHADATRVSISLTIGDDELELTVNDDGRGFDTAQPAVGNGLASLRRRAGQLGAELEIASAPGRGTRARLRVAAARGPEGAP